MDEEPKKKKKEEWTRATGCPTWNFSLVVAQHPDGRFLAVNESRGRGWWLPAGFVEPGDDLMTAAIRETQEEAGIDVKLEGILRIEHSLTAYRCRCRVVFFARPLYPNQPPKSEPDKESEGAAWVTLDELVQLGQQPPWLRGPELLEWGRYIAGGGVIHPLSILTREGEPIPPPPTPPASSTSTSTSPSPLATSAPIIQPPSTGTNSPSTTPRAQPIEDLTNSDMAVPTASETMPINQAEEQSS